MILVADSSALIALSVCDGLALLEQLFDSVVVPETVYNEVARPGKQETRKLRFFLQGRVRQVDLRGHVFLDAFADAGETEAMLLYKQICADKLLVDDRRGRKVAKMNRINVIGSLGVLLAAKERGLIAEVSPFLRRIESSDIHLSPGLIDTVLELAGEARKP
jgi:predicted nucleic acid-binding protein